MQFHFSKILKHTNKRWSESQEVLVAGLPQLGLHLEDLVDGLLHFHLHGLGPVDPAVVGPAVVARRGVGRFGVVLQWLVLDKLVQHLFTYFWFILRHHVA